MSRYYNKGPFYVEDEYKSSSCIWCSHFTPYANGLYTRMIDGNYIVRIGHCNPRRHVWDDYEIGGEDITIDNERCPLFSSMPPSCREVIFVSNPRFDWEEKLDKNRG